MSDTEMINGFELTMIDVGPRSLLVGYGGSGPPLPLTDIRARHMTWGRVADLLITCRMVNRLGIRHPLVAPAVKPPDEEFLEVEKEKGDRDGHDNRCCHDRASISVEFGGELIPRTISSDSAR